MLKIIPISLSLSLIGCVALAGQSETTGKTTNPYNGDETIIVSSQGLREVHSSTRITKIQETFYCESHKLILNLSTKSDYSKTDDFTVTKISVTYDNKSLDVDNLNEKLSKLDQNVNIGFDLYCLNNQIVLSTFAYPGSGTIRESKIDTKFIDLESGNFLESARRMPLTE